MVYSPEEEEVMADKVAEPQVPDFEVTPVEPLKERKTRKKKQRQAAEIDDVIENADWLVAIPATPSTKPVPPREDADFGYREPQRKITPDNPAQMSLW